MANESGFAAENHGRTSSCIVLAMSSLVERLVGRFHRNLVSSSAELLTCRQNLCAFSAAARVPAMSIGKYLDRIFKYAHCSPSVFIVAYVYIDRLIELNPGFLITSLNVHRLLITSVVVATKFLDDLHYRNSYYARVGGLSTSELNILEIEFLFMLHFRLQVSVSVFESYCSQFEREVAMGTGITSSIRCIHDQV
eukprot:Gb_27229 [translate_table: standard]